jgi:hypothetical protein
MRKILCMFCCLALMMTMIGCVRTYTFTRDRVDANVAGNQGVIYGPTPAPHTVENTQRTIYGIDVELPTRDEIKGAFTRKGQKDAPDKSTGGNAGMVSQPEKIK